MNILVLDENNIEQFAEYIPEDMAENLERHFFAGLLAVVEKEPIAGIIWEYRNTSSERDKESHIVWLQIDDPHAADRLFEFYTDAVQDEQVTVSAFDLPARGFEKEKSALSAAGFSVALMEGDEIRATLADLNKISALKSIKPRPDIKPISQMSQREFNVGIRRFAEADDFGICEDLEYLPREYFDMDISCFCEIDEMIEGILLFHKTASGMFKIIVMAALGEESKRILSQMLARAVTNASYIYPPDTKICIDRHSYNSLALSERLFPSSIGVPVYIGSRSER